MKVKEGRSRETKAGRKGGMLRKEGGGQGEDR